MVHFSVEEREVLALQRLKTAIINALKDAIVFDNEISGDNVIWRTPPEDYVSDVFQGWCEFPDEYEQEPGKMCLERLVGKVIS